MVLSKLKIDKLLGEVKSIASLFDLYQQKTHTQRLIDSSLYKQNQKHASEILTKYGKEALDYFKLKKDKSIFIFQDTLIAYKICGGDIVVLGDPVGPESQIGMAISSFNDFCKEHGWQLSFFQTSDRQLKAFSDGGFDRIKIGSEAIVDLENFDLVGPKKKDFRNRIRKLEKLGFFTKIYNGNISQELLSQLKTISDEWLDEPNRIERGFSLGYFNQEYINESQIMTVENEAGEIVAFVNIINSYKSNEMTIDLMRKCKTAPSGVMDYLFVKAILELKERGYSSLSLGLAPMSGFQAGEKTSFAELTVHSIFKRLNFLFNYQGLKVFKDKFATSWEPKFLVFKSIHQLPQLALSIKKILEEIN